MEVLSWKHQSREDYLGLASLLVVYYIILLVLYYKCIIQFCALFMYCVHASCKFKPYKY